MEQPVETLERMEAHLSRLIATTQAQDTRLPRRNSCSLKLRTLASLDLHRLHLEHEVVVRVLLRELALELPPRAEAGGQRPADLSIGSVYASAVSVFSGSTRRRTPPCRMPRTPSSMPRSARRRPP